MAIPKERFSKRFEVRPAVPRPEPNTVPDSIRVKLVPLVDELRGKELPGATSLGPALCESIGRFPPRPAGDMPMIRWVFREAERWEVYDLCEALVRLARTPEVVAERIEAVFAEENLPYLMTQNGIEWRFSAPADAAINEAENVLLVDEDLRGPAEQWQKARSHLAERPPDSENCIKDAIGAVEGAARILSGREAETLPKLITPFAKEIGMHPALAAIAEKLYAYRGDEQGVAHGATRESQNLAAEAELILHISAALIVYLAKKEDSAA